MLLKFNPVFSDQLLTVYKQGDSLTIDGLTLDFSALAEGATLPAEALGCPWITAPVERINGRLVLTLTLPHGHDAPYEVRFPQDVFFEGNGKVPLPTPDPVTYAPAQGFAAIDWSQVVTAEDKAQAAAEQLRATATAEIAKRRATADLAIAPLQDAVDLEDATPGETDALKAWKRYRIALNRLPEQPGFPETIDWPELLA
ncbi:tail fiber assembly protein [Pseudomonas asiatica]|uniref:Tail fiber assembly protein n=1 Tax=Pseudomonas asiatica TaxID=2219225 RepID=A0A9X4D300_9PSED|nr:tail fiber assembly protein [Pseudomonas asiatica]MDD2108903.1 tail fiber assembly protein [Pseudomonas asiatica]